MIGLVSGNDGFIGRQLMRELEDRGWDAVGLVETGGSDPCPVDVRDGIAVARVVEAVHPDVVFHLAAVSGPMLFTESPATVAAVNCLGTIHLMEAASWFKVGRIVFASSTSGYDAGTPGSPRPKDVYGATKRFGEFVAAVYRDNGKVDTLSAQIGTVYGPGRTTRCYLRDMIRDALRGHVTVYDPDEVDYFIHVRDCARYLASLAEVRNHRDTYHLVSDRMTMQELVTTIQQEIGPARFEMRRGNTPAWPINFSPHDLVADTGLTPLVSMAQGIRELAQIERSQYDGV